MRNSKKPETDSPPAAQHLARLFAMDDAVWARHASGWSVYTRMATVPFLLAAIWSRTTIGYAALAPIALLLVWLWLNPRIFPTPKTTRTWAARATFGERVWLNRRKIAIPEHHRTLPTILAIIAGVGTLIALPAAYANHLWLTLLGTLLLYGGKLWFLDRMTWLYEDMKNDNPVYQTWLY